jgi:hypothetical protein
MWWVESGYCHHVDEIVVPHIDKDKHEGGGGGIARIMHTSLLL